MGAEESWQYPILEDIARRAPLRATLRKLARALEELLPGARVAVFLLEGGQLQIEAPSLFETPLQPGFGRLPVDIETDPLWEGYRGRALALGLKDCLTLTVPSSGDPGAVFAIYGASPVQEEVQPALHLAELALNSERIVRKLRESEARFRIFVDHANDGMFLHDRNGLIVDVNRRACETLQYSPEELIGQTPLFIDPDFTQQMVNEVLGRLENGEEFRFESRHRRRDGSTLPVEVRLRPFRGEGKLFTLCLVSDISQRKQSEAVLERQRQLLLETQELAGLGYFEMNLRTGQLTWSDALYRIYGLEPGNFQPSIEGFFGCLHPDDREPTRLIVEKAVSDRSTFRNLERIVRPNGTIRVLESNGKVECDGEGQPTYLIGACLDVTERLEREVTLRRAHEIAQLVSWTYDLPSQQFSTLQHGEVPLQQWRDRVHPEDLPAVEAAWNDTLRNGAPYELEHRILVEGEVHWMRVCAGVTRSAEGRVEKVSGVSQDITVRHKLEEQLRESQTMEAVGRLAGGVAHDFNNLLTVIQGYTILLESDLDPECKQEALDSIRHAGDKAASLTAQLLAFSRRTFVEPQVVDINPMLHQSIGLIRRLAGPLVQVEVSLAHQPCLLRIDPSQFEQILLNLVVNARDAMPQGGKLRIHTFLQTEQVEVLVGDSGQGIPEGDLTKIFEPFFTTKGVGGGTGMGLAVVHGVVTRWGGRVQVESRLQQGTTFRIQLPRVTDQQPTPGPAAPAPVARGSERILLVEDDAAVRSVSRLTLEGYGYQVVSAPLAEQALKLDLRAIDLLLTDVVMPGMDGVELAEILRQRHPQLPILFMSGYSEGRVELNAGEAFLQKPFAPLTLVAEVRRLLDHRL